MAQCPVKSRRFVWILFAATSTFLVQATPFAPMMTIKGKGVFQRDSRGFEIGFSGQSAHQPQTLGPSKIASSSVLNLRGGEVSEIASAAYDWCINLGNPSALVAGAVVATMYECIRSGDLEIQDDDTKTVRFAKRFTRVLLLSAFALEVMSIFVVTVTGTMLLSKTEDALDEMVQVTKTTTPLSFLRDNFEFEYLTARITFQQGLLNWLGAIALTHFIPTGESKHTRAMNKLIGSALCLSKFVG